MLRSLRAKADLYTSPKIDKLHSFSWVVQEGEQMLEPAKPLPVGSKSASLTVSSTAHVLVRVRAEQGLTISAHKKIIEAYGRVFFAKIGKGLGSAFTEQMGSQIAHGIPTFLFIATYEGWNNPFSIYQCELNSLRGSINTEEMNLVPAHIVNLAPTVSTWFEIKGINRVAQEEIKRIHILTSGREVSGSLRGTTAVFKVGIQGNACIKTIDASPVQRGASGSKLDDLDDQIDNDLYGDYSEDIDWIVRR